MLYWCDILRLLEYRETSFWFEMIDHCHFRNSAAGKCKYGGEGGSTVGGGDVSVFIGDDGAVGCGYDDISLVCDAGLLWSLKILESP